MINIVPHLWFDKGAPEAVRLYVSLFEDSAILDERILPGTPSGDVEAVSFRLAGREFQAISGGPTFKFNTAVSLMVTCSTAEEVDRLYAALSAEGSELMPLGEYPFSRRYAWFADRYGLNWQLLLSDNAAQTQKIRPVLLFQGASVGKAEAAIDYYETVFPGAATGMVSRYAPGEAGDERARVNYGEFSIGTYQFVMMDHGMGGEDAFNEAVSFMVMCDDQKEIDTYWGRLSHVPEAEQCGWLKDRFGVSWQIVPKNMGELIAGDSPEQTGRIMQAFLRMKKIDIAALEELRKG